MKYAVIIDGIIINVVISDDPDFSDSQGWVALEEGFWIGDLYDAAGGFSHPDVTTV